MSKPRVFISFDFDNDSRLKDLLVGQFSHPNFPVELSDWSAKQARPERIREKECEEKIKRCNLVLVLIGKYTRSCEWVIKEIEMSKRNNIPVVWIRPVSSMLAAAPQGLNLEIERDRDKIKNLFDLISHE